MSRREVNFVLASGMDESFVESYARYYSTINPWVRYIAESPQDKVLLTERDLPASSFRGTEFSDDWLQRQPNMDAFAGLKVTVDPQNEICIGWHYGSSNAPAFDATAAEIVGRLRPIVAGAALNAAAVRENVEDELRLGAMIEQIDGAALMVERNLRIREANSLAASAFRSGTVLASVGNVLAIRDPSAQRWLEETVAKLVDDDAVSHMTATIGSRDAVFKITATLAPDFGENHLSLLLQPRRRVLLVVKPLSSGGVVIDAADLRAAFGLSTAEIRLCEVLLNGSSLSEAARVLGISDGTVRQRVKVVFQKTRTHRQGELIAVLARFGRGGWPT